MAKVAAGLLALLVSYCRYLVFGAVAVWAARGAPAVQQLRNASLRWAGQRAAAERIAAFLGLRMRPWLLAALIARCAGLRPQTRFGSANYGDDGWQFKKRYALLGAAAAATSVRLRRTGAGRGFQAGMLRIGGATRHVTSRASRWKTCTRPQQSKWSVWCGPARRLRKSLN